MAALQSNERAYLTARVGAARCGAVRSNFVPKDTRQQTTGQPGPYYLWSRSYQTGPDGTIWTAVKR